MNKTPLFLKITSAFVVFSISTLSILYFAFFHLFDQYMLKVEKEKAMMIVQTIEPLVSMNAYLGFNEEIIKLAQQTSEKSDILGLIISIDNKIVWEKSYSDKTEYIHISQPIIDPVSEQNIGHIEIAYTMKSYNQALDTMKRQIIYYLFGLSMLFLIFGLSVRFYLKPLAEIAKRVKDYTLGQTLDLSNIRMEPETQVISDAFSRMIANISEYTLLLEQYKISVDESSIVSKMNTKGEIIYVNEGFCRICGYEHDELIAQGFSLVLHPDNSPSFYDEMWSSLIDKKIWKGIMKNRTKSGEDYYVKSTIVPLLNDAGDITEYISIQHDITQIVQQQEQILRQTTDFVTGLPNRIKLEEDARKIHDSKLALLSLNNYNIIKDYYGYEASKKLLVKIANLLTETLESQDIKIYKLAAGDYALLAGKQLNIDLFKPICQTIKDKVDEHNIIVNEDIIDTQATVGLTTDSENLLLYASLALRYAIDSRKDIVLYEDQENLRDTYKNNLKWTQNIKRALTDDRFTLFVQPIVNANTGHTDKYECLVRMIGAEGDIISPFFFLDIARKTGLYHKITLEVIDKAFKVFSMITDVEFSINLSPEDITHKPTLEFLERKLDEFDVASRLVLEIVESESIENFDEIKNFIARMKLRGCKIAVDDFGTGYSNFSYLMQLNVDKHIRKMLV